MVNNRPIFTGRPFVISKRLAAAYTAWVTTGTATPLTLVVTGDTTYGSFIKTIRAKFVGGSTMYSSPATDNLLRIGILDAAGNNVELIDELYLPRITIDATTTGPAFELPLNLTLGKNDSLYIGIVKSPTNSSIDVTVIGGDFSKV